MEEGFLKIVYFKRTFFTKILFSVIYKVSNHSLFHKKIIEQQHQKTKDRNEKLILNFTKRRNKR